MEWFAYKAKFNDQGEVDDSENGVYMDTNFNTFLEAFLTVFVLLTGDKWTLIYYKYYRATGPVISSIYFLSLMLVG
jgi:uncharacterized membrane protein